MAGRTDPVCGMQITTDAAVGPSEYQGQEFYFCSAACQQKFDENPGQYASKAPSE